MERSGVSAKEAHDLVASAMRTLAGEDVAKNVGSILDSVHGVIEQQANVQGHKPDETRITSIEISRLRHGPDDEHHKGGSTVFRIADTGGDGPGGWPFPFSGKICFVFCWPPTGECWEICIEWWFP